jgi:hypothetical protein
MSEKEESNIIDFSKSQKRLIAKKTGRDIENITDEDFEVFLKAFFGNYNGPAYNPE